MCIGSIKLTETLCPHTRNVLGNYERISVRSVLWAGCRVLARTREVCDRASVPRCRESQLRARDCPRFVAAHAGCVRARVLQAGEEQRLSRLRQPRRLVRAPEFGQRRSYPWEKSRPRVPYNFLTRARSPARGTQANAGSPCSSNSVSAG